MHQAREAAKTTGPSFRHDTPFFGASPAPVFFQPKLTVNEPGDPYEREADEVADKVMRMEDVTVQHCATCDDEAVQRKCPECEKRSNNAFCRNQR
ncbi:hypothetical protein MKQ70_33965 [Chitinophaga sedimenti]|uniref:hypothetical protein n=1 Tax=Chitinophaga sedimenti TaxID=2033606 RepID=UPI002005606E|nr:hypothetical protein [Chitinophaga sedimenti]MCK7559684.1 hypothetical protein [Chitinophaga sedimenti]